MRGAEGQYCLGNFSYTDGHECHDYFWQRGFTGNNMHSWPEDRFRLPSGEGRCVSSVPYCEATAWAQGTCSMSCSADQAAAGFGTMWPGFEWRLGRYETQEKCTFGCSEDHMFWSGASAEQCTGARSCTQRCAYCYSRAPLL